MKLSWLERFARSIIDIAGETVEKDVMKGNRKLGPNPTPSQRAEWTKGAMERLNALVDEETRKQITTRTCPHTHIRKNVLRN